MNSIFAGVIGFFIGLIVGRYKDELTVFFKNVKRKEGIK